MEIYTLASGSSGNSTLIVSKEGKKLLVDVGIGIGDLKHKLNALGYNLEEIDAVLLTHSHIDHTRSMTYLNPSIVYSPYDVKVFKDFNPIDPYYEYQIAGFNVFVLPTSHDTFNGIGFVIQENGFKLVYMTDTGYVNKKLFDYMRNANCYIFESNHDEKMLLNTNRPPFLIKRILSDVGHLSNATSAYTLCKLIGDKTEAIILAHLSEDANTPDLALETFYNTASSMQVDVAKIAVMVAKRHEITTIEEVALHE